MSGGAALTHGFEIAFYALAGLAALGALLSALLVEGRSAAVETIDVPDELPELEAA